MKRIKARKLWRDIQVAPSRGRELKLCAWLSL